MARSKTFDEARFAALAESLGYAAPSETLLTAVTHKSYANEVPGTEHNERLEFLGDAVVGLLIADALMITHSVDEGRLSRLRASMVNSRCLAQIGRSLGLGEVLRLGKGESRTGGRKKDSLLADAYEAVIGAVYRDLGMEAARRAVNCHFEQRIASGEPSLEDRDYKTRLQELVQARFQTTPDYQLVDQRGPDHEKVFEVELWVAGELLGRGTGRAKKHAERAAAREVWYQLIAPASEEEPEES